VELPTSSSLKPCSSSIVGRSSRGSIAGSPAVTAVEKIDFGAFGRIFVGVGGARNCAAAAAAKLSRGGSRAMSYGSKSYSSIASITQSRGGGSAMRPVTVVLASSSPGAVRPRASAVKSNQSGAITSKPLVTSESITPMLAPGSADAMFAVGRGNASSSFAPAGKKQLPRLRELKPIG
jgi:hypothetical protein